MPHAALRLRSLALWLGAVIALPATAFVGAEAKQWATYQGAGEAKQQAWLDRYARDVERWAETNARAGHTVTGRGDAGADRFTRVVDIDAVADPYAVYHALHEPDRFVSLHCRGTTMGVLSKLDVNYSVELRSGGEPLNTLELSEDACAPWRDTPWRPPAFETLDLETRQARLDFRAKLWAYHPSAMVLSGTPRSFFPDPQAGLLEVQTREHPNASPTERAAALTYTADFCRSVYAKRFDVRGAALRHTLADADGVPVAISPTCGA